jgi:hypothetical protein
MKWDSNNSLSATINIRAIILVPQAVAFSGEAAE